MAYEIEMTTDTYATRAESGMFAPIAEVVVDDPFYYGHRWLWQVDQETGKTEWTQIPLTLEDYLSPEEGDYFVQGT